GAVVTFTGVTRQVAELDYEAYVPMAERQMERIVAEAIERHGLCAAAAEHRVGTGPLSEASVAIAVSAPPRAEALPARRRSPPRRPRGPADPRACRLALMSTCLVTGGCGFLGSHLCEELLR